jgi:tetratricopeptide (TPR) repeat protein
VRDGPARPAALLALVLPFAAACTTYAPLDTAGHLERQLEALEAPLPVAAPFALDQELRALLEQSLRPSPVERYRVEQALDFIFQRVGLRYALTPTRNAVETYRAAEGNCLSFVNLFVAVARHLRLNPFYVEVTDHQRWNYRQGMVVSQGHIVAGLYVGGELKTYDFLPYRPKAYKTFEPIDDRTAAAHHYNNLGGEALLAGRAEEALPLLRTAVAIDPGFAKALNNLGAALTRLGRADEAVEVLQAGLERAPADAALLTNLVRAHQSRGRTAEALAALDLLEGSRTTNPFFYVYKAEVALQGGEHRQALEYLRQALARDSELPELHVALARTYLALGEVAKARHHVSRALRLDATHDEALRYARMLEENSR